MVVCYNMIDTKVNQASLQSTRVLAVGEGLNVTTTTVDNRAGQREWTTFHIFGGDLILNLLPYLLTNIIESEILHEILPHKLAVCLAITGIFCSHGSMSKGKLNFLICYKWWRLIEIILTYSFVAVLALMLVVTLGEPEVKPIHRAVFAFVMFIFLARTLLLHYTQKIYVADLTDKIAAYNMTIDDLSRRI